MASTPPTLPATMPPDVRALPVATVLVSLTQALETGGTALLVAPPGSGKTTLVPLALLDAAWLGGRRVVMLEPRRLAARTAALRMASLLGEQLGQTVGYTTRLERLAGPSTRIEVVTEGILTRRLLRDPELRGVGAIIFDEFHERSLDADLGLALVREMREALRPDLRLVVMSATLAVSGLRCLLDDPPLISAEVRAFPVATRWLGPDAQLSTAERIGEAVRLALRETASGVLVFLPGMAEIRRVELALRAAALPDGIEILPLHGDLSPAAQQAAILPAGDGRRKVVLSSAIAETSLTIEGIGAVVDGGLSRRSRYHPRTGMSQLVTVPASRASAEQRQGRAGRLGPGLCYRLWTEMEHRAREEYQPPEISEADLTPLALTLAAWGVRDPGQLRWLTPPPAASYTRALELLVALGAIDTGGAITAHGREMQRLPLHPRLAHMVLTAGGHGQGGTALALAALLSSRVPWRDEGVDVASRVGLIRRGHGLTGELRRTLDQLARLTGASVVTARPEESGPVLALAFPDRIAQRRGRPGRFRLANGRGAVLDPAEPLAAEPWLAVAEVDDAGADARIRLAAALPDEVLTALAAAQAQTTDETGWDPRRGAVTARRLTRLGALVLRDEALAPCDHDLVVAAWIQALQAVGTDALPWSSGARSVRRRLAFLHDQDSQAWPAWAGDPFADALANYLAAVPVYRLADVAPSLLDGFVAVQLSHDLRQRLEAEAPTHIRVPSGSLIALDYGRNPPVLSVRLQELFGLTTTPTIGRHRLPVVLHLLSPAQRPIQVTQDLAGFWTRAYPEVRKELRGRYPKHHWPEDPLTALPRARTKGR